MIFLVKYFSSVLLCVVDFVGVRFTSTYEEGGSESSVTGVVSCQCLNGL